MISLFIDTSTNKMIIGIYKDKKQIYLEDVAANNDLSSKVLPSIEYALNSLDLSVEDIDDIYVVNGPGSFTGIRVGVTIAKTLAYSLNKKIYTISELQLVASSSKKRFSVPMIDARRGYVYAGVYNKNLKAVIEDQYIKLDDLKKLVKKEYKKDEIEYISYDKLDEALIPIIDIERLLLKGNFDSINSDRKYIYSIIENEFKSNYVNDSVYTRWYIYELNNKIVGFINYDVIYDKSEIEYIYVLDCYRRLGVATKLLNKMIDDIKIEVNSITLEVNEKNYKAIEFYRKNGFADISIRKNYYGSNNAILMMKSW